MAEQEYLLCMSGMDKQLCLSETPSSGTKVRIGIIVKDVLTFWMETYKI